MFHPVEAVIILFKRVVFKMMKLHGYFTHEGNVYQKSFETNPYRFDPLNALRVLCLFLTSSVIYSPPLVRRGCLQ